MAVGTPLTESWSTPFPSDDPSDRSATAGRQIQPRCSAHAAAARLGRFLAVLPTVLIPSV